jgi:S-adenosylmethionine decarboxylase
MAYTDTLFQLGMDLTRSSTAQKEDHGDTAHVAHSNVSVRKHQDGSVRPHKVPVRPQDDRKDFFIERDGVRFAGNHLIIDLFGARRLDDLKHVEHTLKRCVEAAGGTLLKTHLHNAMPHGGVAGVAVLAESHMSIHSWPEANYAALDVFMCGGSNPHAVVEVLREAFEARHVVVKEHKRGEELDQVNWQSAAQRTGPLRVASPKAKVRKAA